MTAASDPAIVEADGNFPIITNPKGETMAIIRFRGKVETVYNMDGTPAYDCIRVPEFKQRHCDMHAFRMHPKFGAFANSDLFPGMLRHLRREIFSGDYLRTDRIPPSVEVDRSGYLATVTVHVP